MIRPLQKFSVLFLLFSASLVQGSDLDILNQIRETFFEASYSETAFAELQTIIGSNKEIPSVEIQAYTSASVVLSAKYLSNPFTKIGRVYEGLNLMNELIEENSNKLELRFLRFAIEYHIPSILFFKSHLEEDKQYIVDNSENAKAIGLSSEFSKTLLSFLEETTYFSQEERTKLREALFE